MLGIEKDEEVHRDQVLYLFLCHTDLSTEPYNIVGMQ